MALSPVVCNLQVYPGGIRHVRADGRQNEWKTPRGRPIKQATANARQVAISLEGGEVIYFELGEAGTLQVSASTRRTPRRGA